MSTAPNRNGEAIQQLAELFRGRRYEMGLTKCPTWERAGDGDHQACLGAESRPDAERRVFHNDPITRQDFWQLLIRLEFGNVRFCIFHMPAYGN